MTETKAKGGLNRVPLPDLPPPPARGRTRTLPGIYLGRVLINRVVVSGGQLLSALPPKVGHRGMSALCQLGFIDCLPIATVAWAARAAGC
jgi:hypothetical protein